jgi:hypothetical protein
MRRAFTMVISVLTIMFLPVWAIPKLPLRGREGATPRDEFTGRFKGCAEDVFCIGWPPSWRFLLLVVGALALEAELNA